MTAASKADKDYEEEQQPEPMAVRSQNGQIDFRKPKDADQANQLLNEVKGFYELANTEYKSSRRDTDAKVRYDHACDVYDRVQDLCAPFLLESDEIIKNALGVSMDPLPKTEKEKKEESEIPKKPKVEDAGIDNSVGLVMMSADKVFKSDDDKRIVYGVVLTPDEVDAQEDWLTKEDIEQTAHDYLVNARVVGSRHSNPIDASVVESYIAPTDFYAEGQYGNQLVKKGSWVMAVKISDDSEWDKVKKGEYTGFSVGGFGTRE
jgi:hypothetical protein